MWAFEETRPSLITLVNHGRGYYSTGCGSAAEALKAAVFVQPAGCLVHSGGTEHPQ